MAVRSQSAEREKTKRQAEIERTTKRLINVDDPDGLWFSLKVSQVELKKLQQILVGHKPAHNHASLYTYTHPWLCQYQG